MAKFQNNSPWSIKHNYLDPVAKVVRAIVREYAAADETRKAELRLRNPDLDLDKLAQELPLAQNN